MQYFPQRITGTIALGLGLASRACSFSPLPLFPAPQPGRRSFQRLSPPRLFSNSPTRQPGTRAGTRRILPGTQLAVCAFLAALGTLTAVEKVVRPDGTAFPFWDDRTDYRVTYHVACRNPQASAANPGTPEKPWRTIGRATECCLSKSATRPTCWTTMSSGTDRPTSARTGSRWWYRWQSHPARTTAGSAIPAERSPCPACPWRGWEKPHRLPAPAQQAYQPLGDLLLAFDGDATTGEYRRELDMERGVATISYRAGGVRFTKELNETTIFSHTSYNVPCLLDVCEKPARQAIEKEGGKIEKDAKGEEFFVIPVKQVGKTTATNGWPDVSVDLSEYQVKSILLQLLNQPTDWNFENGYWEKIALESK